MYIYLCLLQERKKLFQLMLMLAAAFALYSTGTHFLNSKTQNSNRN
jgi:hypothetical protein